MLMFLVCTKMTIEGDRWRQWREHCIGLSKAKEIDGDGFKTVRHRRRSHRDSRTASEITIESKIFQFKLTRNPNQNFVQIWERRHNLWRSIFVHSKGIPWLRRCFEEAFQSEFLSQPKWRNGSKSSSFEGEMCYNPSGSFLRITGFLPDERKSSICIPEGHRRSRWVLFLKHLSGLCSGSQIQIPTNKTSFPNRHQHSLLPNQTIHTKVYLILFILPIIS